MKNKKKKQIENPCMVCGKKVTWGKNGCPVVNEGNEMGVFFGMWNGFKHYDCNSLYIAMFNPQPKPEKKEKVKDLNYWNKKRSESMLKSIKEKKVSGLTDADEKFFRYAFEQSDKQCIECGLKLEYSRWWVHHLLPKSKYPMFRHNVRNTVILCYKHHAEAESSVSYPKMWTYGYMESIKKELLGE